MNNQWDKLPTPLVPQVMAAINELNFKVMTPVQAACIPLFLSHKDVAVEALTGSGKTLAFIIPIVQILLKRSSSLKKYDVGALIISPTRELATQIHEVLEIFLKFAESLTSVLFVGGKSVNFDLNNFSKTGSHVIVCTPGKFEDLLAKRVIDGPSLSAGLKALDVLVLDEADRLLDSGFSASLNTILAYLPKLRRTGIFSATQTDDVINLIRAGMRNPVQIKVKDNDLNETNTPSTLQNYYIVIEADQKTALLELLLKQRKTQKIMIFFSTCACVAYFTDVLNELLPNTPILALHGKMKQRRYAIFDKFRKLESGIILCTDVLCRGVDIPQVDWVFQFDPPVSAASFVHRCGRTARNGNEGSAIVFLLPNELEYVTFIDLNQKVKLKLIDTPTNIPSCLDKMRNIQINDRAIMDKATRAYVSHIQAYSKHECQLIISLKKLNLGRLATGYGLVKLPRMPELKALKNIEFIPIEMDFNTIKYVDKIKEKERQSNLKTYAETGVWPSLKLHKPKFADAWSDKKEKRDKKHTRREKRKVQIENSKFSQEDLDTLDEDFKMITKFKKKKISDEALAQYFGLEEDDDKEISL